MRYLVTGGCGFIGSHLAERLVAERHSVAILDDLSTGRREFPPASAAITVGDISDEKTVHEAMRDIDGCFHLAAIASVERSRLEWVRTHQVNLTGTIHVFNAAGAQKIPVVYASSASTYGEQQSPPFLESTRGLPISAYGADKLACELHGNVAARIAGVPNIGLRFFNVYGPRQDPNSPYTGVLSIFAKRALQGNPLIIHGDGLQARDFVYVGDVARALALAMNTLHAGKTMYDICNVGTGIATSVRALAGLILQTTGASVPMTPGPARAGDPRLSVAETAKARTLLGFVAQTPLEEGLANTIAYIKAHEL